jgi:hypothetical protein
MHNPTQTLPLPSRGFNTIQDELLRRWGLPADLRAPPVWPAIVAALIILAMLLAFVQVVHAAVHQSEVRHKAIAVHAEKTWRCKILRGANESENCLSQLKAVDSRDPQLQARNTP